MSGDDGGMGCDGITTATTTHQKGLTPPGTIVGGASDPTTGSNLGGRTTVNNSSTGGQGREHEGRAIDGGISSGREDSGLAALEGLSLEELGTLAAQEIDEARQLQAEAIGLSRRSTATLYRAGRVLWCARKKLKGKGKRAWTKWQKANGIPVTSAWQAIRLYEEAEGEEAVVGLTRTKALKMYGITKPKKDRALPAPVEVSKAPVEGITAPAQDSTPESPDIRLVSKQGGEAGGTATVPVETKAEQTTEAQVSQDAPTTLPPAVILFHIVRRLEVLEQDNRGGDLGDEAHALIDRAIATLRRLRDESASAVEAA